MLGPNEDWAQARLTFRSGCVANFSVSRVAWQPQRTMHVVCADAVGQIDFGARAARVMRPCDAVAEGRIDVNAMSADERALVKDRLFTEYLPMGRKRGSIRLVLAPSAL